MRRAIVLGFALAIASILSAEPTSAQEQLFSLTSRRTAPVPGGPGATVTLVSAASNRSSSEVTVTPSFEMPPDWQVVTGAAPFALRPGESETIIVSIAIPTATAAGTYSITLSADFAAAGHRVSARDSAVVAVREHRSISVALLQKPPYVIPGEAYVSTFRVVNRGNSPARALLTTRSSLGRASSPTFVQLEPGASRDVAVKVQLRDVTGSMTDEILEVAAMHVSDSTARGDAAARIALVPTSGRLDGYSTVASVLRLRAVPGHGGVAPFDLTGGGALNANGSTSISFSANGRSRGASRFGERESYRLDVRTRNTAVKLGDHHYSLSPLTGSGNPGVGASIERSSGAVSAGAFGQRFRSAPQLGAEMGAFAAVRTPGSDRGEVTFNFVDRTRGPFAGRVTSSEISLRPTAGTLVNAEYAMTADRSIAYNTRFAGRIRSASLDAGHLRADTGFRGPQRGSKHDYLDIQLPVAGALRVAAFASKSATIPYAADSTRSNTFANAGLSATIANRFTVELSSLRRSVGPARDDQRAVRVRSDVGFSSFSMTSDARVAIGRDSATNATRLLRQLSLAPRIRAGHQTIAAHFGISDAGSTARAGKRELMTTAGLDVAARVRASTSIGISGFGTHTASTGWTSQADVRVSQTLASGMTASARAHLVRDAGAAQKSSVYLELGVPMRLPVARRGGPGRVIGRVADAATGRPVRNAVVRVGSRLAVTNGSGKVSLRNVPPGEYRVTLGDDTTLSNAVLVGAKTLVVDSLTRAPAVFAVSVARGAFVRTEIRRMARARTVIDSTLADSLVDAGPMANVLVSLTSARDTLYEATDGKGKVSFTDVAPGEWVLAVVPADIPANHAFDRERQVLSLEAGETVTNAFVLLPRRRAVQMVASTEIEVAPPAVATTTTGRR